MEKSLRVLIIDDDELERKALIRALTKSNVDYDISESDSAKQALECLITESFDVILLDYRLPGTNGIEFLIQIKNSSAIRETAIVMVSNHSDDELVVESINAGAHDFLLKEDVTPSQLKRSILQSRMRYELENKLYDSYQKVKKLAERDSLTGLYNRYHFDETILQVLKTAKRNNNAQFAIMMLDLDNFKNINDTHGHDVGDLLIKEVAERLRDVLRSNELLSRFGGDEFALVCENVFSIQQAKSAGKRIVNTMNQPFDINGSTIHCTVSVGLALFPANGDTASELMRCADIAMYRAKQSHGEKLCVYKDNMQESVLFNYKVESELRRSEFSRDFSLNYQPIYKNGIIEGAETLIRWPNAVTCKRPDLFIPVAEECGVIFELGSWILQQALKQMAPYLLDDDSNFYLSINVSPHQLRNEEFSQQVLNSLVERKINPQKLVLEITETVLLKHDEVSLAILQKLSSAGIRLALDDFGTGYSSLSHLVNYPIDIVKVDKSLLEGCSNPDTKKHRMLTALSLMLNKLNLKTIVEGVEKDEQAEFCHNLNFTSHQGYLYCKPLNFDDFSNLYSLEYENIHCNS